MYIWGGSGRARKEAQKVFVFFVGVEKFDFPHLCVKLNIKKPAERIVGLRLAYIHTHTHTPNLIHRPSHVFQRVTRNRL